MTAAELYIIFLYCAFGSTAMMIIFDSKGKMKEISLFTFIMSSIIWPLFLLIFIARLLIYLAKQFVYAVLTVFKSLKEI